MRLSKNAKVVATLGPASDDRSTIQALFEAGADVCRTIVREGFGKAGDTIVISAGMPFGSAGTTNLLRIAQIR